MGSIFTLSILFQLVCSQSLFHANLFANSMNSHITDTSNCKQIINERGSTNVDCSGMNLTSISLKSDFGGYYVANFSGNNFHELNTTSFHIEAGSIDIVVLLLQNNNITAISDDVLNNRIRFGSTLDLSNNRLTRIPFLGKQPLSYLYLQHNRIEVVEAKSLRGLTMLQELDLSHCEIYMVEPDAFDGFMKLNYLSLSNNRLSILAMSFDKLNGLQNLQKLEIYNNKFVCDCKNYDLAKFVVKKERDTDCAHCSMKYNNSGCLLQLNDSFCAINDVTLSKSFSNPLTAICSMKINSENTKISFYRIDDEGNSREIIKNLPAITLDEITNDAGNSRVGYELQYDNSCKCCRIYCVAENIAGRTSSNILFSNFDSWYTSQLHPSPSDECKFLCINCHLTDVPEINFEKYVECPSRNTTINLSSNDLQYLTKNIFANKIKKGNLSFVQNIILRNCRISRIDEGAFNGMSNLKLLDLNGNALTTIPKQSFVPINQLEVLDLGGNQLEKLDSDSFEIVKELKILNLTSCAISHISTGTFIPLKNTLVELHMGSNRFKNISFMGSNVSIHEPASSSNIWKHLRILDLNRNPLTLLSFAFSNMINLKYLDLSSCKTFTTIANNTFYGLRQLRTLNLSSNKIQEIHMNTFTSLRNMVELKLNDNWFNKLSVQVFNSLSANRTSIGIDLKQNTFHCTCHNLNLYQWLRSNPHVTNDMIDNCSQEFSEMQCELELLRMKQIDNRNIQCEVKAETGHVEITWFWDNLPIPATNSFITSIVQEEKLKDTFISTLTFTPIDLTYTGSKLKCVAQDEVGAQAEQSKEINVMKTNEGESFKINSTPLLIV